MGSEYESYEHTLQILKVEKLAERRQKLTLNFAKRCEKSEKYSYWFQPAESVKLPNIQTRSEKNNIQPKYKKVPFRTERYEKSPIPFLTQLLNEHHASKK